MNEVKDKPPGLRWQALFQAVVAHGPTGVVALALIVILACIVSGVSAAVIYAMVALIGMMILLILVVGFALRRGREAGDSMDDEDRTVQTPADEQRK
jgi:uncharacterized protein YacL